MIEQFKIYKFGVAEAEKVASQPNDPHVHEFEELLVGMEGELEHLIDFNSDIYRAPYVSFITKGKVHRVKPKLVDGKCSIWVIRFSSDFIPGTSFNLYCLYHDAANILIQDEDYFKKMVLLCELMHSEYTSDNPSFNVIRDLLRALFSMIEVQREKNNENQGMPPTLNTTFKNFLAILEENFRRPEAGVEFYAEKLFMSSRNLNLICQKIINMSVSDIIETRRMTEAKSLLSYTDKSVSEIGYEIGYNEKSLFTTAFKRTSGITPTSFREQMRAMI